MKILQETANLNEVADSFKTKIKEGKWNSYNRVLLLKTSGRYEVIRLNIFERMFKAVIGNTKFFNMFSQLKNATVLSAKDFEKISKVSQDTLKQLPDSTKTEEKAVDTSKPANEVMDKELWQMVFENLGPKDLVAAKQVSKAVSESVSKTATSQLLVKIENEMKLLMEAVRPYIFTDYDQEVMTEFPQAFKDINNRNFQLYFSKDGELIGFSKKNMRIYQRDKSDNSFKPVEHSIGDDHNPLNLPFKKGEYVELWLHWTSDSSYLQNSWALPAEEQEVLEKEFPVRKVLERALFHFGSKFLAGVREVSKENAIYTDDVLKDPAKFPSSVIWEKSKDKPIPDFSITSKDIVAWYAEVTKFGEPTKMLNQDILHKKIKKKI